MMSVELMSLNYNNITIDDLFTTIYSHGTSKGVSTRLDRGERLT
jgi:hypothetical protein